MRRDAPGRRPGWSRWPGRRCPCRADRGRPCCRCARPRGPGRRSWIRAGDGVRDLERARVPRLDGGGQAHVGPIRRAHRAECRLRAHATGHRPARPRGGRRLSLRPDRPGRPGGRRSRHGRRPRGPRPGDRASPERWSSAWTRSGTAMAEASRRAAPARSGERPVPRRRRRGARRDAARRAGRPRHGRRSLGFAAPRRARPGRGAALAGIAAILAPGGRLEVLASVVPTDRVGWPGRLDGGMPVVRAAWRTAGLRLEPEPRVRRERRRPAPAGRAASAPGRSRARMA